MIPPLLLLGLSVVGARRLCPPMVGVPQPPERTNNDSVLAALRQEMKRLTAVTGRPLDGLIVTTHDLHMSPYSAERDRRLRHLTGFTGDFGLAAITADNASLWVHPLDYWQADNQVSCTWNIHTRHDTSVGVWLREELQTGDRLGLDLGLVSHSEMESLTRFLNKSNIQLVHTSNNLVDAVWPDRPPYSSHPAVPLPITYSGRTWGSKVKEVREIMKAEGIDALVITALDEVAWLLNMRGRDIPYLPVVQAFVLLTGEQLYLYTNLTKLSKSLKVELRTESCYGPQCVRAKEYGKFLEDLQTLSQVWRRVWLPINAPFSLGVSEAVANAIPGEKRVLRRSPIVGLKAVKNSVEREGMRRAHVRDAAAVVDFMAHLEHQVRSGQQWTEVDVAMGLDQFRMEQHLSQGVSFATVVGFGPHGAHPHHEPNNLTALTVDSSGLLVIDSGGHYLDGTTDVTRTFHLGRPSQELVEVYTRVLRGLVAASAASWPRGVSASALDMLARGPLWKASQDFMHGTGHGVGHYLSVHEGPTSLFWQSDPKEVLRDGNFFSIEPGYYVDGKYGIRLENVVEVRYVNKSGSPVENFLELNTVTLVPFEPKLIDYSQFSPQELAWLNNYNKRVRDLVGAELKRQHRMRGFYWMMKKAEHVSSKWCNAATSTSSSLLLPGLLALSLLAH